MSGPLLVLKALPLLETDVSPDQGLSALKLPNSVVVTSSLASSGISKRRPTTGEAEDGSMFLDDLVTYMMGLQSQDYGS